MPRFRLGFVAGVILSGFVVAGIVAISGVDASNVDDLLAGFRRRRESGLEGRTAAPDEREKDNG